MKKFLMLLVLIPSLGFCSSEVRKAKHFSTAQEYIKIFLEKNNADNTTKLFVFDIDGVIEQQCPFREIIDQVIDCLLDDGYLDVLKYEFYGSCVMLDKDLSPVPVDKSIHAYVKELQKQGCKVICLTNTAIGPYGYKIPSIEDFRIDRLKSNFGLDFSHAFEALKSCIYVLDHQNDLLSSHENASLHDVMQKGFTHEKGVVFKDGILFANSVDKGIVLENFLATVKGFGYTPSSVVFIDDRFQNIASIVKVAKKWKLPALLIHYDQEARLTREVKARIKNGTADKLYQEAEEKLKAYDKQFVPNHGGMSRKPKLACGCFIF